MTQDVTKASQLWPIIARTGWDMAGWYTDEKKVYTHEKYRNKRRITFFLQNWKDCRDGIKSMETKVGHYNGKLPWITTNRILHHCLWLEIQKYNVARRYSMCMQWCIYAQSVCVLCFHAWVTLGVLILSVWAYVVALPWHVVMSWLATEDSK